MASRRIGWLHTLAELLTDDSRRAVRTDANGRLAHREVVETHTRLAVGVPRMVRLASSPRPR